MLEASGRDLCNERTPDIYICKYFNRKMCGIFGTRGKYMVR